MCTEDMTGLSSCCPSVLNPITEVFVCNCIGQESPSPGYTVGTKCELRDIDECLTNNGGCHRDAVCRNLNAVTMPGKTFECICPPGMSGDGVRRCDQQVFMTRFGVTLNEVPKDVALDLDALVKEMYEGGMFPKSVMLDDITISLVEGNTQGRRLLGESGVEIEVVIISSSVEEMQSVTEETDTSATVDLLCKQANETQNCSGTSTPPLSEVSSVDQAFGPMSVELTGLSIESVQFDIGSGKWIVHAKYKHNVPNTIASLYVSKPGKAPYTQEAKNTFFVSMHPCMRSNSVCCMNQYKDRYEVGPFHDNITNTIGTCPVSVRQMDTLSMWSPEHNNEMIDRFFEDYPLSYVQRVSETEVKLHISTSDLRQTFAMVEEIGGGYTMDIAVGMSYYTMLPAPAISTVASQVKIFFMVADSITFSFAAQQEYNFLKYITLTVFQVSLSPLERP